MLTSGDETYKAYRYRAFITPVRGGYRGEARVERIKDEPVLFGERTVQCQEVFETSAQAVRGVCVHVQSMVDRGEMSRLFDQV